MQIDNEENQFRVAHTACPNYTNFKPDRIYSYEEVVNDCIKDNDLAHDRIYHTNYQHNLIRENDKEKYKNEIISLLKH